MIDFQQIISDNDFQLSKERGYWLNGVKIQDIPPIPVDNAYKLETKAGSYITINGVDYLITSHRLSVNSKDELFIRCEIMIEKKPYIIPQAGTLT